MSVGSQEATSGGDILSQALFQTGLSTPVKIETDEPNFILPENGIHPSYDTQNLAEDLISGLGGQDIKYSVQQNLVSTPPGFEGFSSSNKNSMYSNQTLPLMNNTSTDNIASSIISPLPTAGGMRSMPILRKLENGIVPTWKGGSYNGGSATSDKEFGEIDVDLEDLLSINVDEPSMESYSHPQSSYSVPAPASNSSYSPPQYNIPYPAVPPTQQHQALLTPTQQHQAPLAPAQHQHQTSELPELMDLDNILGDDFFDSLNIDNGFTDRTYLQNQGLTTPALTPPTVGGQTPPSGRSLQFNPHSSAANISNGLSAQVNNLLGSKRDHVSAININQFARPQKKILSPLSRQVPIAGGVRGPSPAAPGSVAKQDVLGDSDEEDDEDYTTADTYANYVPAKVKIGLSHPDSVVESSSLSSVDPPEVYFDLKLPQSTIQTGKLSSLQLESVVYACQQHMNILADGSRAGFLVGDGAGVGKGRTIAGIIYQNYLEGRKKAIWLSVSNDLRVDALRDLKDIGAKKLDVYSLNKFHYGKISGKRNGRVRKGVIFATYSSLIGESSSGGKYKTRFDQLLHWLGSRFEGVIVFDECHKAKNLVPTGSTKPSKTGLTVLQLQKKLPKARIVYCSATGASEPKNMAYMSRLGIWGKGTQFNTFQDFIKAVERRGVGAMEIVAIDMKLRGMYIARQLSFSGVTFSVNKVELSDKFIETYDASVKLWVETRRLFQEAADMLDYDKRKLKTMWGQFWASHQRFFKYMCIAAKVPETIRVAKKALTEGKCIVIGLQSTGEARTLEQLERSDGELSGFISTTKGVLETLIRRHFPAPAPEPGLMGIDWSLFENGSTLPQSGRKKRRSNGPRKPRNTLQTFHEEEMSNSDSEDSSGSPERSDSAVESSSDEGDRSSEGSGSSSSESEDDADSDLNPFGVGDFSSEPWLQKKKTKVKSRKRPRSPSAVSGSLQKRRKNFSIKPPPHSSKKGKTKTGFNSKNLNFEPVQSPDTQSSKISPSLLQQLDSSRRPSLSSDPGHTSSIIADINNRNFANARTLGGGVGAGLDGGRGSNPFPPSGILASPGVKGSQNVLEAMSTKFNGGIPVGDVPEMVRNASVKKMKEELLRKLELLSPCLPSNTLDELIDGLGGTQSVAEMTGRRGRVVSLPGGGVQYQLRSEQEVNMELLNIREKQRFMDGEKKIAIISEAASSGISLQADRRVKNQKRRVHITLELPWSADRAIQQFGRTHRSNQVSAPEYIFLISALSGEQRFASIVAKRLESLGALTHGDRRATETRDLSKFNVDTKYGRQSLENTIKSIVGAEEPLAKMEEYDEQFFDECRNCMIGVGLFRDQEGGSVSIEKDAATMSRFLNRILGLPVRLQNKLFAYFSDTLAAVMVQAKRTGKLDAGILDFGSSGQQVEIVKTEEYVGDVAFNTATTQLYTVQVGRGMTFDEALKTLNSDTYPGEGIYVSKKVCNNKRTACLFKVADSLGKQFMVCRPNTGRQGHNEKLSKLLKKYDKVDLEEGKKWWDSQYESSLNTCIHAFWQGNCRLSVGNQTCSIGLRSKTYYMLSGSVLGVWSYIEGVFNRHPGHQRMQIIRVKTESKKLVGIKIPKSCIEDMRLTLTRIAQQAEGTEDNPITL